MKLIFIRHGEPDYNTDSLTENGIKEAKALAKRTKDWNVTQFYVSPLGRANQTASYTLDTLNRTAITLDFLREFSYPIEDKTTGRIGVAWDFVPSDWTTDPNMFKLGDAFLDFKYIKDNTKIRNEYPNVINGFDNLLKEYGYIRDGYYYRNINSEKRYLSSTVNQDNKVAYNGLFKDGDEPTLVFFCHLGVTCLILSHLLNIPFECLTHGFFIPTTGITILSSEERWDNEAYFRVQALGDVTHLLTQNVAISPAGSFADPFQK